MINPVFTSLSSSRIAAIVESARSRICLVAPGIQDEVAAAIAERRTVLDPKMIQVSIDFSDATLRMGYVTLQAVNRLRKAGIEVTSSPGIRTGVLVVDEFGWLFTPTPLLLEKEPQSEETPNAINLLPTQLAEILPRIFPPALDESLKGCPSEEQESKRAAINSETGSQPISEEAHAAVTKSIELAPPVKFDLARQVRVYQAYLQYVELKLTGVAIQKHRVRIPAALQQLGTAEDIEGRLRTTFDLIENNSDLSSPRLESELTEIRNNFTPSLGKNFGRLALKAALPHLRKKLDNLQRELTAHQARVHQELQAHLDESRKQVVDYYLPLSKANLPDELAGQLLGPPSEQDLRDWIEGKLRSVFPSAESLVSKMELEIQYKDVTFETLNQGDFLDAVKNAFPRIDWEKTYNDMMAAGEEEGSL